jgi:lactate permease
MVGQMVSHAAGGWVAVRRLFWPALLMGVVMGGIQYIVVTSGFWNIGAFCGGLAGLIVAYPLARRYRGDANVQNKDGDMDMRALAIALSGYAVLVTVTLGVQLLPNVKPALSQIFVIEVEFPEITTALGFLTPAGLGRRIPVFSHAGMILAFSSAVAYFIYRWADLYQPGAPRRILSGTLRRVMSSSVSIASMVAMAVIMQHSGMTETLAQGLAKGVGRAYPLVAPWIGALGAFMTGSNTNSNVVFGALQLRTAVLLSYSVAIILAAQTAGAAVASIMAPTKVVVGASTAGMAGREGDVMRKLIVYTVILLAIISLLAMLGVWLL